VWIRDRLTGGEQLVGSFLQVSSLSVYEVLAQSGVFRFLCVEGEHSGLSGGEVASLVRGVDLLGVPCVVRVAGNNATAIAVALDSGAAGVLVPRVNTAAEAVDAVRSARFPPEGVRGLGPGRATGFGSRVEAYVAEARENTLVCVQVETGVAVEQLDQIAAVEGVDLVFVGPGDLALSLGLEGERNSAELQAVIDRVLDRAVAAGKLTGMFAGSAADARVWLDRGVAMVLLASDLSFLRTGIEREMAILNGGG
jgi:4-hydroxy-2-oxoheptanedioate aldolase